MNEAWRKRGGQSFTWKFYPFLVVKVCCYKVRPRKWDSCDGWRNPIYSELKMPQLRVDINLPDRCEGVRPGWLGDNIMGQGVGRGLVTGPGSPLPRYQGRVMTRDVSLSCVHWLVVTRLETVGINNGIICCYQVSTAHWLSHIRPWSLPGPDCVTGDMPWEIGLSITYFLTLFPRIPITNLPLTFILQWPRGHTCVCY